MDDNNNATELLENPHENGLPTHNPMQPHEDNVLQDGPPDGYRPVHGYAP